MTTQLTTKRASKILFIVLIAVCCGASLAPAHAQRPSRQRQDRNTRCPTSPHSAERVAGETALMTRAGWQAIPDCRIRNRHATLWRNGLLTDLGTLGGPNSSVTWNVKNTAGHHRRYFPNCRLRSRSARTGVARLSTVRLTTSAISISGSFGNRAGQMRGLPNFPGGNNGFATGANNLGQVVGWAENGVHDPDVCVCTQVLQFRPAVWDSWTTRPDPRPPSDPRRHFRSRHGDQ